MKYVALSSIHDTTMKINHTVQMGFKGCQKIYFFIFLLQDEELESPRNGGQMGYGGPNLIFKIISVPLATVNLC